MSGRWLWPAAVVCWLASGFATAFALDSVPVDIGDLRFNFGQLVLLLGLGFAWGDLKASNKARDERMDRIEKRLDELDR